MALHSFRVLLLHWNVSCTFRRLFQCFMRLAVWQRLQVPSHTLPWSGSPDWMLCCLEIYACGSNIHKPLNSDAGCGSVSSKSTSRIVIYPYKDELLGLSRWMGPKSTCHQLANWSPWGSMLCQEGFSIGLCSEATIVRSSFIRRGPYCWIPCSLCVCYCVYSIHVLIRPVPRWPWWRLANVKWLIILSVYSASASSVVGAFWYLPICDTKIFVLCAHFQCSSTCLYLRTLLLMFQFSLFQAPDMMGWPLATAQ